MTAHQTFTDGEVVGTWEPDAIGRAMMETARIERKRAAERDGIHPGGLPSAKRTGPRLGRTGARTVAGKIARTIIAERPGISAQELSRRSGLSPTACRATIKAACGGNGTQPFSSLSPAGIKAREILAANPGISYRALSSQSGLSHTSCRDLIRLHRRGPGRPGPRNGEGGRPRDPSRETADRMARDGRNVSEICAATGVSRAAAYRAIGEAKGERTA